VPCPDPGTPEAPCAGENRCALDRLAQNSFVSAIAKHAEITECLLVARNVDYVLRIWVRDLNSLGTFICCEL
jgi:DNA-binding Lrp family transcriptional regulator